MESFSDQSTSEFGLLSMEFDDDIIPNNQHISCRIPLELNHQSKLSAVLQKKSPAMFVSWQSRLVELDQNQLKYYKVNNNIQTLAGVLNFDLYCCKLKFDSHLVFEIHIKGLSRTFEFKCESEEQYEQWKTALIKAICESEGFKKQLAPPPNKEFWRIEQISQNQFLDIADTFDVLLFKINTSGGKVIRMYTASEFDHVAMVLRFNPPEDSDQNKLNNRDVWLIEATSNLGVRIKRWSSISQGIGNFFEKVAIRHLDFEREECHLQKLEKFLKEVNGRQYGFKPQQLMARQSVRVPENDQEESSLIEKDRRFFCSELIAKCFKVCGIIQLTDQASCNFLPADFTSAKDKLKLSDGITIKPEQQITINANSKLKD